MGNNVGLMPVPRSFPPEQAVFLQKLLSYVQLLGGSARDKADSAVRRSEANRLLGASAAPTAGEGTIAAGRIADGAITGGKIAQGTITARELRAGCVEASALATGSVVTSKIKDTSVTTGKIADDAITGDKIADGAVTKAKLFPGLLTGAAAGAAVDGETVTVGHFADTPVIAICRVELALTAESGTLRIETANIRQDADTGEWLFDALARFERPAAEEGEEATVLASGACKFRFAGRQVCI